MALYNALSLKRSDMTRVNERITLTLTHCDLNIERLTMEEYSK